VGPYTVLCFVLLRRFGNTHCLHPPGGWTGTGGCRRSHSDRQLTIVSAHNRHTNCSNSDGLTKRNGRYETQRDTVHPPSYSSTATANLHFLLLPHIEPRFLPRSAARSLVNIPAALRQLQNSAAGLAVTPGNRIQYPVQSVAGTRPTGHKQCQLKYFWHPRSIVIPRD